MTDLQDIEDTLTTEEEQTLNSIQKISFCKKEEKEEKEEKPDILKPFGIWSVFNNLPDINIATKLQTRQAAPFSVLRSIGIDKVVTINNISGKNAYVILTSAPIKNVKSLGLGAGAAGFEGSSNMEFEDQGEYKAQKLSIANNTRCEYDLDNSHFYCTLFLNIDDEWKKTWDNRRFNGRKFDINILERHVQVALEKDNIPDF
jgi:hypothetical protein